MPPVSQQRPPGTGQSAEQSVVRPRPLGDCLGPLTPRFERQHSQKLLSCGAVVTLAPAPGVQESCGPAAVGFGAAAGVAEQWCMEGFLLGAAEHASHVLSKVPVLSPSVATSVAEAVGALNRGAVACEGGLCAVYSESSGGYVILYRGGRSEEALALAGSCTERRPRAAGAASPCGNGGGRWPGPCAEDSLGHASTTASPCGSSSRQESPWRGDAGSSRRGSPESERGGRAEDVWAARVHPDVPPWSWASFKLGGEAEVGPLLGAAQTLRREDTTSTAQAVQWLNEGRIFCPGDFCIMYSSRADGYVLLFREGRRLSALAALGLPEDWCPGDALCTARQAVGVAEALDVQPGSSSDLSSTTTLPLSTTTLPPSTTTLPPSTTTLPPSPPSWPPTRLFSE